MNLPVQKLLNDPFVKNLIDQDNYAAAVEYLIHSQMNSWELLKKNYDALINVQIKSFWYDGFKIKVQFNPERMISTAAKVDVESVANRKCFLCIDNIPEEQKGILLRDKFLLLCNPYPIFPQHFTISLLKHEPQRIDENFPELLELTKLLASGYTLVYNGPACGASAPDHLHFQVGTKLFLPIEDDIQQMKNDYGIAVSTDEKMNVSFINDGIRRLIFIESNEQAKITSAFKKIFSVYKDVSVNTVEPMMNIICSYDIEFGWNVIIFLRSKHRPEYFFSEDPEKILVSPAAIDLGGILVTPREEDYAKMDEDLVWNILDEVLFDKKAFSILAKKLKDAFD
jgi:hypothetical protein